MSIIIDIESRPQPEDVLLAKCPPAKLPKDPGEFDPSVVKVGRLTEEKAKAKVEEAARKHADDVAEYKNACKTAAAENFEEFKSKAALSAMTGEVLAIGYGSYDSENTAIHAVDGDVTERLVLLKFWEKVASCRAQRRKVISYNGFKFDIPFLVHRSWFHEIDVPVWILDRNFRYLDPIFVDIRKVWDLGNYQGFTTGGIGGICQFFGLPAKPETSHVLEKFGGEFPMTGEHFWRYWDNSAETREIAKSYLQNDVAMVRLCAPRMGVK